MRVLIASYFRAEMGGLHLHILAQARALACAGHEVVALIRGGPFAEVMRAEGFAVLETNYEDFHESLGVARSAGHVDLVHAHPFASRRVGLALARELGVPFLVTFHGPYLDHIADYGDEVDLLLAVSDAVRDRLVATGTVAPERVAVVPNGVDTAVFHPAGTARDVGVPASVAVVSRLDRDKAVLLEAVKAAWSALVERGEAELNWVIAGDGDCRSELEAAARAAEERLGRRLVSFLGWQDARELAAVYRAADVAVAPGRCALEALACGTPTIAVGSRGYGGPVDGAAALRSLHGNFGGFSVAPVERPDLLADVERILGNESLRRRMVATGSRLVDSVYAQAQVDRRLVSLVEIVAHGPPRNVTQRAAWQALDDASPHIAPGHVDLADWQIREPSAGLQLERAGDALRATCSLPAKAARYASRPPLRVSVPPDGPGLDVTAGERLRVRVTARVVTGAPRVSVWLIEFDGRGTRLAHARRSLAPGENRLEIATHAEAAHVRVALRFAGDGVVDLTALHLERKARSG